MADSGDPMSKPDAKTLGDMVREAQAAMAKWPAWMREAALQDAETFKRGKSSGDSGG